MAAASVLERAALVLNKRWAPIRFTPVREAIGLVAKGAALIIEPETYRTHDLHTWDDVSRVKSRWGDALIRSARLALVPPEVIVLTSYEGLGERSVVFSRRNLFKRDRYACRYCGAQPGPKGLTVDHVLPRSRGGVSSWENCVLSCVACNARKANRTPDEAAMKLRKPPKKPVGGMPAHLPLQERRETWEQFISRAYWEVELEP